MDAGEKKTLQKLHMFLIHNINELPLDYLYRKDVITDNDIEEITAIQSSSKRISKLIYIISKRGPDVDGKSPFETFKDSFLENNRHIVDALNDAYQHETQPSVFLCLFCFIIENVIAKDIVDGFYAFFAITDDTKQFILDNTAVSNETLVVFLLQILSRNLQLAHEPFLKSLEHLHDHVRKKLLPFKPENYCSCFCGKRSSLHSSEVKLYKTPEQIVIVIKDKRIKSIQRKYEPVWRIFFLLREAANWEGHEYVKSRININDIDNRSLMCWSELIVDGYFQLGEGQFEEMFKKAEQLLPGAQLYHWHAIRLFCTKVFFLIKHKLFEEAETWLNKAKYLVSESTMQRGIVTAIVHYADAWLNWQRFTYRPQYLLDQVQNSFESAIDHYEEEDIFTDIRRFVPQVFVFMALCALQVDLSPKCKPCLPRHVSRSKVAIKRAREALLRMRKEPYWSNRTLWSDMLYHLASGELFLSQDMMPESLIKFKDALSLAEQHKFPRHAQYAREQIEFIKNPPWDT